MCNKNVAEVLPSDGLAQRPEVNFTHDHNFLTCLFKAMANHYVSLTIPVLIPWIRTQCHSSVQTGSHPRYSVHIYRNMMWWPLRSLHARYRSRFWPWAVWHGERRGVCFRRRCILAGHGWRSCRCTMSPSTVHPPEVLLQTGRGHCQVSGSISTYSGSEMRGYCSLIMHLQSKWSATSNLVYPTFHQFYQLFSLFQPF